MTEEAAEILRLGRLAWFAQEAVTCGAYFSIPVTKFPAGPVSAKSFVAPAVVGGRLNPQRL